MFCYKLHKSRSENYELVFAACDKELVGKKIRKNPEFEVKKEFYSDKECDEEKAAHLLEDCTIANLIGEEIVKLALKKSFITKENVILIEGIPHAQIVK